MKDKVKKALQNFIKKGFIYTVLCFVLGILLIVWPNQAVPGIVIAILFGVTVIGIASIIYYFISPTDIACESMYLLKGLLCIEGVGIVCLYYFLRLDHSVLVFITSMCVMSAVRFQGSIDMLRRKLKIWYVFLIIASLVLFSCGIPYVFAIEKAWLYRIVGILFVFECFDDFICRLILKSID